VRKKNWGGGGKAFFPRGKEGPSIRKGEEKKEGKQSGKGIVSRQPFTVKKRGRVKKFLHPETRGKRKVGLMKEEEFSLGIKKGKGKELSC